MVYVPLFSNEAMVANMVIGATPMTTVTPANPTPPTNITYAGFTPPSTVAIAAPADPTTWGDPHFFAANSGGRAHEAAPYDGYDTLIKACYNTELVYSLDPNIAHPSCPGYAGATVAGVGEDAIGGNGGEDSVEYASEDLEDLEDLEEEANEAVKEARDSKPRRGRPPGRHK